MTSSEQELIDKAVRDAIYYPVSDQSMQRGEGIYLYDLEDKEYIDCASATFNLSLGYGHPAVVSAIQQQAAELIHVTSSFQSAPISDLVRRLVEISPKNLTKVHLKVSGGSEANEGAVKMAQYATGKKDVITLFRSHLGQTMMMASLSGNAFRRQPFPLTYPGGLHVPDPYCFRCFYGQTRETCGLMCVDRIDDFIEFASSGRVAAVMVEPVSGNGGNIVPPDGYFQQLRKFCDERDIALIFDEIQTGIGRTGQMFAAQHFDVQPDAITVGKGLGGAGAQVAGILTNERLAGLPGNHHSFTYGANLLAAAAANATVDIIRQPEFLANVRSVGNHILARLAELKKSYPAIGDVRGIGLMLGMEIIEPDNSPAVKATNHLAAAAQRHGLIIRTSRYGYGNVLKIRPPLIMTHDEADIVCDRLEMLFREEFA
ncbi:aspartate aminotransferase family protein [Amycolatopsis sp. FU40]|uniref:aspartate aminotransferase family protein n=1 Tax=Amycolatopsis sp. FU40 TaxID=2914159 RepID=UPI001F3FEAE7|nr:aspartate aminotransferase family protein [Amycolatopsis sp. FU40]UKD51070.1 aspartate aminotransferase family protein [Amycolatopsis sp. FU40]